MTQTPDDGVSDGQNPPDPLARMADDLERIAAHLVPLLKNSYTETTDRLARAERTIASRQERPAIAGMHRLLSSLRRLDPSEDAQGFIEEGITALLNDLGYQEFGAEGEAYDPARHEAVGGQTERGKGLISRVHRRGLACHDDVMIRATVEVRAESSSIFDFEVLPADSSEGGR